MLFSSGNIMGYLIQKLIMVPIVLISLTFHECAHGWVSSKLGDPTPKASGRLTLNPLAHIDPVGAVLMVLTRFGWAKPVPIDPRYYKNPKTGMAITAAAVKIVDLEETIKRDEKLLGTLTDKLFDKLSRLDNDKYIAVLWKKYGEGKNNSVIADELNYSVRYIRQLQGEAFRLFTKSL